MHCLIHFCHFFILFNFRYKLLLKIFLTKFKFKFYRIKRLHRKKLLIIGSFTYVFFIEKNSSAYISINKFKTNLQQVYNTVFRLILEKNRKVINLWNNQFKNLFKCSFSKWAWKEIKETKLNYYPTVSFYVYYAFVCNLNIKFNFTKSEEVFIKRKLALHIIRQNSSFLRMSHKTMGEKKK